MAQKIQPCPKCGCEDVAIAPSFGGKGTGDLTAYYAQCSDCKFKVDHLSKDGTKRSAISEWNQYAKTHVLQSKEKDGNGGMVVPGVLNLSMKSNVDEVIEATKAEKNWSVRPALFLELLSDSDIPLDALILEDRKYVPVSIYMLLRINDTTVADLFYKTYGAYIQKTFTVPDHKGVKYSYLTTFYRINEADYNVTTDVMTGAVFLLKDISFSKATNRNEQQTAHWLQYLLSQIDSYMADDDEKEAFRAEIETELKKVNAVLLESRKMSVSTQLDRLMSDIDDIDDVEFLLRIKGTFDRKINERIMA